MMDYDNKWKIPIAWFCGKGITGVSDRLKEYVKDLQADEFIEIKGDTEKCDHNNYFGYNRNSCCFY